MTEEEKRQLALSIMAAEQQRQRSPLAGAQFQLNRQALSPRDNTHSRFAFRAFIPRISSIPDSLQLFCSQFVATGRISRFTSKPVATTISVIRTYVLVVLFLHAPMCSHRGMDVI